MPVLRLSMALLLIGLSGVPSVVCGQASDSLDQVPDSIAAAPDSAVALQSAVAKRVAGAFSSGDASRLLNPAADRIEISLFGARTFYSSAQALYVLREFFRSHAPRRFVVGNVMETGTTYLVQGAYEEMRAERPLRVYVRLDRPEGEDAPWHLQEVRIEGASN
ncbi:MAG: DUF4783 domain-containing protein [Salinibacter sp.]